MHFSSLPALWAALGGLIFFTPALSAGVQAEPPVSLQFIANEGILVSDASQRLLIDGAFTVDYGVFQIPDADTLDRIAHARSPFDHLTAILVSHRDGDHVDPSLVAAHLASDPQCVFHAPAETVALFSALPEFDSLKSRLRAIPPEPSCTQFEVGSLRVQSVALRHLPRPAGMAPELPVNVGYLFRAGGITFFHTGDTCAQNLEALRNARLADAGVDVLLINWLAFEPDGGRPAVEMIRYLHPKVVLLAHLTRKGAAEESARVLKLEGLPPVIPLATPLRLYSVVRTGDSIEVR